MHKNALYLYIKIAQSPYAGGFALSPLCLWRLGARSKFPMDSGGW